MTHEADQVLLKLAELKLQTQARSARRNRVDGANRTATNADSRSEFVSDFAPVGG